MNLKINSPQQFHNYLVQAGCDFSPMGAKVIFEYIEEMPGEALSLIDIKLMFLEYPIKDFLEEYDIENLNDSPVPILRIPESSHVIECL